jgi:hypothetical protein
MVSIAEERLGVGKLAGSKLLLAATDDTPEGRYEIVLDAVYLGYTPMACEPLQRLQRACPKPRVGPREKHSGVRVPLAIVDVAPGDPARRMGEKRLAKAEAEEARRKAEERAAEIAGVVSEVEAAMGETDVLIRKKKWEEVRERLRKLSVLFEPLHAIGLDEVEAGVVPAAVEEVRARLDVQRDKLAKFEDDLFDRTFKKLTESSNKRVPEERLLEQVARRARVSIDYVKELYLSRTEEMQRRLDAQAQARLDELRAEQQAREERCGPLPTGAWGAVRRYVEAINAGVEVELGECLTPRLAEADCWEVRCDYTRRVEISVTRPEVVTKHRSMFYLVRGKVVRHR